MKKLLALVLTVLLTLSLGAGALSENVLRVGMECNYAPYNWTQADPSDSAVAISAGGYADGYDVEIAKLLAQGLGMELEIVKTEWDGLVMSLTSGKIDAIIAGMSPTAERKTAIDFSDPYYESELVLVVSKDGPYASATKLSDLSGAKITGQLNTFHYTVIDQIPGVTKVTAMETFPAMIVALTAGAIDGYVSERPGAISAMSANPNLACVQFGDGQGFACEPSDAAISVGLVKGSALLEPMNQILAGLTKEDRQALMDKAVANQPLNAQ
ncbi:MAG: transporter substrate-binding domain-containing protein [Clostridia bacterium]